MAGPTSPADVPQLGCVVWSVGTWAVAQPQSLATARAAGASSRASPSKGVPSLGRKKMEGESPTLGMLLCFRCFGLLSPAQRGQGPK